MTAKRGKPTRSLPPNPPPTGGRGKRGSAAPAVVLPVAATQGGQARGGVGRRVLVWTLGTVGAMPSRRAWLAWSGVGLAAWWGGMPVWLIAGVGVRFATPLALWILRRSHQRSPILSDVSSRVKSRAMRRRVRARWNRAMYRAELAKPSRDATAAPGAKDMPKHGRRIRLTPYGVQVPVSLHKIGRNADDLRAKSRSLQSSFGANLIKVADAGPGRAVLDLRHTDPLARVIRPRDLPKPSRPGLVVVGIDEDGLPVEKDLRLPSLMVGAQGSGKSSEAWMLLHAIQRAGIPCRTRIFDPKGGQEFTGLADSAHSYERNPTKWGAFLASAFGAMEARQADLASQGVRELTRFTPDNPLDLMLVDELVTVLSMRGMKVTIGGASMNADEALLVYLSQARAAGFTVLALSQLGTKDVIGPVRAMFAYATCLRVGRLEEEMVNVILGSKASTMYPAHLMEPVGTAGIGYLNMPGRGIVRYRAAHLTDRERQQVASSMRRDTKRFRDARAASRTEQPSSNGRRPGLEVVA